MPALHGGGRRRLIYILNHNNMKQLTGRNLLATGFILYLLLVILGFCSCKAVEKYKASDNFAADCAAAFPVKTDSIYIEGATVHDTITTYNYGVDTIWAVVDSIRTQVVTKEKVVTRTVTVNRVDTVVKVKFDSAAVKVLMNELKAQDKVIGRKNQIIENRTKHRLWLLIALLASIALFFAIKRK